MEAAQTYEIKRTDEGVLNGTHHCVQCGAKLEKFDHFNPESGDAVCDECFDIEEHDCGETWLGLRKCNVCGRLMYQGYTNLEDVYVCDECWDGYAKKNALRENPHDDCELWDDGYWDAQDADGTWYDTGIFWTDWEE